MDILARVFFDMDSRESHSARVAIRGRRQIDIATFADRSFVLTNLITLGQVGIEIAFAIENRVRRDSTMRGQSSSNSQFDRSAIEYRQDTRHPHAYRTDVLVRTGAEGGRASAEKLRVGQQMSVDFESNHGFVCFAIHCDVTSDRDSARLECSCALERVARAQDCFLGK